MPRPKPKRDVGMGGVWRRVCNESPDSDNISCRKCGKLIPENILCFARIVKSRNREWKVYYCDSCFLELWI